MPDTRTDLAFLETEGQNAKRLYLWGGVRVLLEFKVTEPNREDKK